MNKKSFFAALLFSIISISLFINCSNSKHETPPSLENKEPDNTTQDTAEYPQGLTVTSFSDNLSDNKVCLGFYAIIDYNANPKLEFHPRFSTAKKPTKYFSDAASENIGTPYIAVNGGFFGGTSSVSLLIDNGVMKSIAVKDDYIWSTTPYTHFYPVRAALGQMNDGSYEATWIYCMTADNDKPYAFPSALGNNEKTSTFITNPPTISTPNARKWEPRNAIGAGPMLVYNGQNVAETNYWKEIFDCGGLSGLTRQPRTAIGVTNNNKMVIIVCDGRNKRGSSGFTLLELATKLIQLGCTYAINLDGGGSSTFIGKDGKVLNMPSDTPGTTTSGVTISERSIPTAIVITER